MTLRYHELTGKWAIAVALLAAIFVSGCGGGGDINGGGDAEYTLELVAEKDLGNQVDYLHIRFLKDGISVVDGYVKVNDDSLSLTASGYAFTTYAGSHFSHGEEITIEAGDPAEEFIYTDSVFMPTGLTVDVVPEADTIWQPTDGAVNIDWTLSNPVSGYIVSVTPRLPDSPAPGLASEAVGGSFSFSPVEVFFDQLTDTLVSDLYDVRVVAYNRTYVRRTSA
ncbi:MAG: hypothetical protein GF341_07950, partial [candidate division Zixibacteria bacterium]|nr:hypothetical protein [candidate division Zixibacteria bacterium]